MRGDRTTPRWCGLAVRALLVGLVLRSAIPLGYMPGNLLAGEFMVLCPTGVSAVVLEALSDHHAHHDMSTVEADRDCPIGSALTPAWISNDWSTEVISGDVDDDVPVFKSLPVVTATIVAYRQRAPPQV